MREWVKVLLGAAIVIAVVVAFSRYADDLFDKKQPGSSLLAPGQLAPDIDGNSLDGRPFKLSGLKGKVVLIDFWAVWCGPCVKSLPHLRDWYRQYNSQGLEIVGVTDYDDRPGSSRSVSSEIAALKQFASQHSLDYRVVALPQTEAGPVYRGYGVSHIPHVVLVDRKGYIRAGPFVGAGYSTQIENAFRQLLAESGS
jgi:thiol-disulfide isomerase/thioredoxin